METCLRSSNSLSATSLIAPSPLLVSPSTVWRGAIPFYRRIASWPLLMLCQKRLKDAVRAREIASYRTDAYAIPKTARNQAAADDKYSTKPEITGAGAMRKTADAPIIDCRESHHAIYSRRRYRHFGLSQIARASDHTLCRSLPGQTLAMLAAIAVFPRRRSKLLVRRCAAREQSIATSRSSTTAVFGHRLRSGSEPQTKAEVNGSTCLSAHETSRMRALNVEP
ncbi:hypothetical protein AAH678_29580 [Sodalis endosymbiont of Spalangia cameroni]|uniref:hypothetical protein n=1 Tax=Sodalis praecaptivus TaxID=1239307 RepID=UPI0031F94990